MISTIPLVTLRYFLLPAFVFALIPSTAANPAIGSWEKTESDCINSRIFEEALYEDTLTKSVAFLRLLQFIHPDKP